MSNQHKNTADGLVAHQFLRAISDMLATGRWYLHDVHAPTSPWRDDDTLPPNMLGWEDTDTEVLYLLSSAKKEVQRQYGPDLLGDLSSTGLYRELDALGVFVDKGADKTTKPKSLHGRVVRVLVLRLDALHIEPEPQEAWLEPGIQLEWLLPGVIRRGEVVMLTGGTNMARTYAAIDIGTRIRLGKPWLDVPSKQANVAYIGQQYGEFAENLYLHHVGRFHADGKPPRLTRYYNVLYTDSFKHNSLLTEDAVIRMLRRVDYKNPELIIVDNFASVIPGYHEDSAEAYKAALDLRHAADDMLVAVLLLAQKPLPGFSYIDLTLANDYGDQDALAVHREDCDIHHRCGPREWRGRMNYGFKTGFSLVADDD